MNEKYLSIQEKQKELEQKRQNAIAEFESKHAHHVVGDKDRITFDYYRKKIDSHLPSDIDLINQKKYTNKYYEALEQVNNEIGMPKKTDVNNKKTEEHVKNFARLKKSLACGKMLELEASECLTDELEIQNLRRISDEHYYVMINIIKNAEKKKIDVSVLEKVQYEFEDIEELETDLRKYNKDATNKTTEKKEAYRQKLEEAYRQKLEEFASNFIENNKDKINTESINKFIEKSKEVDQYTLQEFARDVIRACREKRNTDIINNFIEANKTADINTLKKIVNNVIENYKEAKNAYISWNEIDPRNFYPSKRIIQLLQKQKYDPTYNHYDPRDGVNYDYEASFAVLQDALKTLKTLCLIEKEAIELEQGKQNLPLEDRLNLADGKIELRPSRFQAELDKRQKQFEQNINKLETIQEVNSSASSRVGSVVDFRPNSRKNSVDFERKNFMQKQSQKLNPHTNPRDTQNYHNQTGFKLPEIDHKPFKERVEEFSKNAKVGSGLGLPPSLPRIEEPKQPKQPNTPYK